MRQISLFIIFFGLMAFSLAQTTKTEFSQEALTTSLFNEKGDETSVGKVLNAHKGKTVLIDIWASWCPDCVKSLPKLQKIQVRHSNVVYLFFSVDKEDTKWKNGIEKYMHKFDIKGEQYTFGTGWGKNGENAFIEFIELDLGTALYGNRKRREN